MNNYFMCLMVASIFGLGGCKTLPPSALRHVSSSLPVWIDTDPSVGEPNRDVDDGLALLQSFHSPELAVRGVSIVYGNTSLKNAYPIGRKIIQEFGPPDLQVYRGAASASELGKENEATQNLLKALQKEKLTLISLGPLTNIGTLVRNHPEIHSRISEIIAVAGRRPHQRFTTGNKNLRAHRDFNFEQDPQAFQVVLNSDIPITLTPFEISSKIWINSNDIHLWAQGTPATRWIAPSAMNWLTLWKRVFFVEGFNPFDTLAIAYLTSSQLIHCEVLPVQIQILPDDSTEKAMQGTQVSKKPYLLVSKEFQTKRTVQYCFEAESKFKEDLMNRLLR